MDALIEAYAISRATKCERFLYSLSVNPPKDEQASSTDLVAAINRAEESLGLSGQPRAIVFHEKNGRRHAHAVWSRIDATELKAVHIAFDHKTLMGLSRELFLEHGWKMPEGLAIREKRNPKNFTLAEWQQAKRTGQDPRAIKTAFQDAWALSDSKPALEHALEERGYVLARGDRRGYVAVDIHGEVYSIPKMIGIRTKSVRERLGDPAALCSVEDAKTRIADDMAGVFARFRDELDAEAVARLQVFEDRRKDAVRRQRAERKALEESQRVREIEAAVERQARFRRGLAGLWDRLRGAHRSIQRENEREALVALEQDRAQKDTLIHRHLEERRRLDLFKRGLRQEYQRERQELDRDAHNYDAMRPPGRGGPEP